MSVPEPWTSVGYRTPVYMAPEQLQTTAAYLGTAVDVWASGVMLLVMMVRISIDPGRALTVGLRVETRRCCRISCLCCTVYDYRE